jgi:DNA-binding CsgD family transcriptional regulator/tetratricopeptide (TPR) repeat protein
LQDQCVINVPGFVGRERELAALRAALAAGPVVLLVEGEAGIGKSRLVREFLAGWDGSVGPVLVGVCPPFAQPYTLSPIVDAVRHGTDSVSKLELSPLAGALRPVFPEWAGDLPADPDPLDDARAARHRLFRALLEVFDRLGAAVLVVEDAHWADEATLEFLLFVMSQPEPPFGLVVTYRPDDVPDRSLLHRLSSRNTPVRITIGPLDAAATSALVSSMLDGGPVSAEFARFIRARTDGVPLMVEESIRLLHERADLIHRDGEWMRRHDLRDIDVPPTVRDAVLLRYRHLGPGAQAVLRALSVLVEPVTEASVAAVSGLDDPTGLAEALESGLVREDHDGLVSFRHVLAARAVYDTIPGPRRRALHLRAAGVLEHAAPPPVARLAHHFRQAGDEDRWCRYAERAADLAVASGDEGSAASLLYDVLTTVDLSAASMVRLVGKLPLVSFAGPRRFDSLVAAMRRTVDSDRLTPAEEGRARMAIGRILTNMEEHGRARAELERAVSLLPADDPQVAYAMALLGAPDGHDPGAMNRLWLRRSAHAAPHAADPLRLHVQRATALLGLGEESGWIEAAGLPWDSADPMIRWVAAVAQLNIGNAAILWGRYADARRRLEHSLAQSERHEYLRLRDIVLVTRLHLDYFTGAWDGLAERAAAMAGNDDMQPVTRTEAVLLTALLHAATGEVERAERVARQVLAEFERRGAVMPLAEPAAAVARLRLAGGDPDEALAVTTEPVRILSHKEAWIWGTDLVPARVEALLAVDRTTEATDLVTAFDHGLRGRDAPAPHAGLALCRALIAGDPDEAASLFADAAACWQALPRPYDALLARERQAYCLLAAGHTDTALALLADLLKELADLGARAATDRVLRSLREHGVDARRPGRGGRPSYGDQLSPREIEVVQLLAAGHTNPQIAGVLVLSTQTVASHVRSAMRKLRVRSRTALAVRAVELGLVQDGSRGD